MVKFILRLLKKKYIIIMMVTVMVFGIAGTMYNIFVKNMQKSMFIEFNYPGAEKGLNPDGSVFDISELKSPELIEKAKQGLNYQNIDTEYLRSRIFITTKVTDNSVDQVISAVQSEKNIVYMPTTFYIYFSQKDKFQKNESGQFMKNLADAYADYFERKYSEKNGVLDFKAADHDFENADYLEIYRIFENKVGSMLAYIRAHQNENRAFYSDEKVNLGMVAKKIETFRDTSLAKFYAYIVQNSISKNNSVYVKELNYLIDESDIEYEKTINSSDILKEAISKYDPGIAAVAFIPSVDVKHNFYMSRTKTGIDDLTKRSYSDGVTASKILKDMEYYKSLKEKFIKRKATAEKDRNTAEQMIKELSDNLESISSETIKTDNEYLDHKTMDYYTLRLPAEDGISLTLIAKFMILGFMLAFAIVFFLEFIKKYIVRKYEMIEEAFETAEYAKRKRGE